MLPVPAGGRSFPDLDPNNRRYSFGKKQGVFSKRPFNPDEAGLPVSPRQYGDNPNLDYQIWNDNHTATLEDYGLSQNDMYDLSTHVEED